MKSLFSCVLCWWIINWFSPAALGEQRDEETFAQVDLESDKQNVICARERKPLDCSAGSLIAINNAFWGRLSASICPSEDGDLNVHCGGASETLDIVRGKCDGKESCELEARHDLLQKPGTRHCPGTNKYLVVTYTCEPKAKEVVLCDSENSTISCPESYRLFINSVFWGRQSTQVCPSPRGLSMCMGTTDSLGVVRNSCQGRNQCQLHAAFGDVQKRGESCPGVSKYLIVNYSCKNEETSSFLASDTSDVNNVPLDFLRKILARERSKVVKEGLGKIADQTQPEQKEKNEGNKNTKSPDRIVSVEITSPGRKKVVKAGEEITPESEAGQKKKEDNPMILGTNGQRAGFLEGDNALSNEALADASETQPEVKEFTEGDIKAAKDADKDGDSKEDDNDRKSVAMQTKDYSIDLEDLPGNIVENILKIFQKQTNSTDGDGSLVDTRDIEVKDRKKHVVSSPVASFVQYKKPEDMNLEELKQTTINELKKSLLPRPRTHGVLRKKNRIAHPSKSRFKYYGHGFAGLGNVP